MIRSLSAVVLLGLGAAFAPAATTTIEFTVDAGKQARANEPVCIPLTLAKEFAKVHVVNVMNGKAPFAVGQLTAPGLGSDAEKLEADLQKVAAAQAKVVRELHFLLPALEANNSLTLTVVLNTNEPEVKEAKGLPVFKWTDTKGESEQLDYGSTPVLRYMYQALDDSSKEKREETFKVYHHLFDPAGKRLVTKGVGGLYTHHRGIFYGFKDVTYDGDKKVDIWHCPVAYQAHEKLLASEEGPVLGRHRVQIGWHGKGEDLFAREEREVTVYHVPGGTLLEFVSRLKTTDGTVKLDGDPQHSGFHFRADDEVSKDAAKAQTTFIRPYGVGKPGEERNWPKEKEQVDLPWDAMSFVLGGQRYTAAYLDRPDNPKEARYSERTYGRFGSYFVAEVTKDKPLTVRYRLWLQEGQMKGDEVAGMDDAFVKPVKVNVK
jgi:hypothetical protein